MNLYRAVGLQELGLIYDGNMKAFPEGLSQQPIFYPVLQVEYARQIASDWNIKSGEFAGYVTQFKVDGQYIDKFEEHAVGDSPYQELWIPAEALGEFNKHIVGSIKTVEAYFGDGFQGFIPEKFGLQGKNAVEQFTFLANTYIYKRMDFYLEIRRNHKAVYLNYPFWQKYDFKNSGLKEKLLKAIKEAWLTSFPQIPLVADPIPEEVMPVQPFDSSPELEQDEEENEEATQSDFQTLESPTQEDIVEQTDIAPVLNQTKAEKEYIRRTPPQPRNNPIPVNNKHIEPEDSDSLVDPEHQFPKPFRPTSLDSLSQTKHDRSEAVKPSVSYFSRGVQLGLSGNAQESVMALSRAIEEDPENVAAHISLGVALHTLGEDDRALSCYEAARKVEPRSADAHYFQANILYSQGNIREAIAGYTIAIGLEPKLIEAHKEDSAQDRLTDYTPAPSEIYWINKAAQRILVLDALLDTDPRQADLFKERAAEYYRLWNYEQAAADYSASLALQPNDASALHLRGVAYEQLGQYDLALKDYQQAMSINPQMADMYINRGIEHANKGNFRQAVASLSEGIRLAPRNPDIYFNRGMSHYQGGDLESAMEDFSLVIQLSPDDEEAFYWRGISNEQAGRIDDAIADYKRFLELSQNAPARQDVEQRLRQWQIPQ